jgi:hypothetical protein
VTSMASRAMQKADLDAVTPDVHGLISKEFGPNEVMMLPPGHDAWSVGDEACVFVEFSRGNDYYG